MEMSVLLIFLGFIAGILTGTMGVGGGVVLVPMMVLILAVPQHLAQGTSMLVIIPTVLAACYKLRKSNLFRFRIALFLALGSIAGSLFSSNWVQQIDATTLKSVFGILVMYTGIRMMISNKK